MSTQQPFTATALSCGSHLALKGLRHAILGRPRSHLFTYAQAFGCDAADAARLLVDFTETLGRSARRPLRIRKQCCGLVTPTELSMLGLLAAAGLGDKARQTAHLDWLTHQYAHVRIGDLAGLISGLFCAYGLEITSPCETAPAPSWPRALEVCGGTDPTPALPSAQAAHRQ